MELEHMIENMKKALKRDKLVIFVGAGVSKNSGIPTWGQMVRQFAERMDYPVNRLSTTEYIRIPQYFMEWIRVNIMRNIIAFYKRLSQWT